MDMNAKKTASDKAKILFIVSLIGVFVMILGMFLPYMTAVGDLAEYINGNPDRIESYDPDLTAGDLKNISVISASKVATAAYGEAEGTFINVVVFMFGAFLALTTLFTVLKKPIPTIVFDVLTCGIFVLFSNIMKYDFHGSDKYAWGIGFYAILLGFVIVLVGSIWMLVNKVLSGKKPKNESPVQPEV